MAGLRESKSRMKTQNTSFSSSLLDEIYRSMDVGYEKPGEFKFWEAGNLSTKQSLSGGRARASNAVEDEGITTLRRAFLVQKWMDIKVNAKNFAHRRRPSSLPDSDRKPAIDDDPFLSSGSVSQKPSCFGPFRPKPIKTHQQNYMKQPISPGSGRLTTFLNSLFTNGNHLKKPNDLNNDIKVKRTPSKSPHGSTCSSASSFTRSCLTKYSPRSREINGIPRSVRFYPVSVIIDEDCRPCGEKFISGEKEDFMKVRVVKSMSEEDKGNDYDDDDDDFASDASSDLFELDHLSILREYDELPVYETTNFGTNRAIAKGLIC